MGYKIITKFEDVDGGRVTVQESVNESQFLVSGADSAYFTKEQAPALALAILEAAGYSDTGDGQTSHVVRELRHILKQAEYKENEQLDKEAKAIYNAFANASIFIQYPWEDLEDAKHPWIAAAKKARELHKGAK